VFEKASNAFLVLLGCAWAFSIATARATGDKVNIETPATAAVANGLSAADAPSTAYLSDAVNSAVVAGIESDATGESGKLRAEVRGASEHPGIVRAALAAAGAIARVTSFSVITLRPASDVRRGRLGLYYIGSWPRATTTRGGAVAYRPPSGFIEVTPQNENTNLSEHFRIRDFLTHDQPDVWPKYEVVSLKLVDKLELVLADLKAHGINSEGVHVMSGFRTPQYNRGGGDPTGRASLSRHMYGDAADIYIDNSGSGQMSDLNHDGRVNIEDARVILASVNRVEREHPSLVGGCGIYVGNGAHGPFVHIDTRGYPARWTGTGD
jgi:peptidase M15-like protein